MASGFIVSVTETDFEYEVIAYSQNTPVIVDFWADWCKPCKILTPILEKITLDANGDLRLAEVDVDSNPSLALRFSVRTIPTVIAFSQGNKGADFTGIMPESRVREFIDRIKPPSPANLLVEKGNSLLAKEEIDGANDAYLSALKLANDYPGALLGLMKVNVLKGNPTLAHDIFLGFPACREYNEAERLIPLIKGMEDLLNNKLPVENDLDAAFVNSVRLATRGNIYASIDGFLEVLRQDKKYHKDKAKNMLLGLLELLDPESDQTRLYRSELASILF